MYFDLPYLLIYVGIVALGFYIRIFIKSTIEKSVDHQFDVKLEKFKQDFTREMTALERKDKFRLAALDRRLETHQEAYALARKMFQTLHSNSEEKHEIIKKVDDFLDRQCLFLTNETRQSFREAFFDYSIFQVYLARLKNEKSEETKKDLFAAFGRISGLPNKIEKGIDIEAMSTEILTIDGKKITPYGIEDKKNEKL